MKLAGSEEDQLRQEYIDLRAANPSAVAKVAVPAREQIKNSGQWIPALVSQTSFFSAGEIFGAANSPYTSRYAYLVVDKAFTMMDKARREWKAPLNLGSTWRSPKYNASLGTALTSKHQTGDACDVQTVRGELSYSSGKIHLIKHVLKPYQNLALDMKFWCLVA